MKSDSTQASCCGPASILSALIRASKASSTALAYLGEIATQLDPARWASCSSPFCDQRHIDPESLPPPGINSLSVKFSYSTTRNPKTKRSYDFKRNAIGV